MKIFPLFMELTNYLTFKAQRQILHDVTNDVNVNFLICGFAGCMKKMLFLANILFIILSMCAMVFAEKLTLIHFCLKCS